MNIDINFTSILLSIMYGILKQGTEACEALAKFSVLYICKINCANNDCIILIDTMPPNENQIIEVKNEKENNIKS